MLLLLAGTASSLHRGALLANRVPLRRHDFALQSPPVTHSHQRRPHTAALNAVSQAALLSNPWYVWSVLSSVSTFGVAMERTQIGSMLSSPLVTMMTSMLLCNVGLLPKDSLVYNTVLKWLVPLAIPLLLLDADLKRCLRTTGSLLKAFLVGSVGTVIGTLVAYALVPMRHLAGAEKIAAALCARHIGGAVNFVAVSDILQASPELVAAAMAADNVVVAVYFAFLFLISVPERGDEGGAPSTIAASPPPPAKKEECPIPFFRSGGEVAIAGAAEVGEATVPVLVQQQQQQQQQKQQQQQQQMRTSGLGLLRLMSALSVGLVLCTLSQLLGSAIGTSPMLLVSLLAVLTATAFPATMGKISKAGGVLGVIAMQFFFSVTGGMGHIPTVLSYGPALFLHTTVQIIVHFGFSVAAGRLLGIPFRETVLASNSNVGGPTTAAAMATTKRWKLLVLPALLTGILGYAMATGVGVAVVRVLPFVVARKG